MSEPPPFHQSPFSKNKNTRSRSYDKDSSSSDPPQFKITAPPDENSKNSSQDSDDMPRAFSPLRASFTIGEDIIEEEEPLPSNSDLNTNTNVSFDNKIKISWDSRGDVSNLQDLFIPPEERNKKRSVTSPLKLFKNVKPYSKSSSVNNLNVHNNSDPERYEDINQMTAQTMASDFVIPPRPYWSKDWKSNSRHNLNSNNQKIESTWFAKTIRFFKKGRSELNVSVFKHVVKSAIAFFLASLIIIVEPINQAIGKTSYMAPLVTVFFDNSHTIGAQLEITFLTCCFMAIGFVYYLLAHGLYIIYNRQFMPPDNKMPVTSDGSFILAIFFFGAIFFLGWFRAKFVKFSTPANLISLILITNMTNIIFGETEFHYEVFSRTLASSLIGIGISLFVNVILWPESASQDLGKSLEMTLKNAMLSIKTLTSCFLLNEDTLEISVSDLEDLHSRSMTAVNTLVRAGKEARHEYTYSVHPPSDYKGMINIILSLQQQLGGFNLAIQRERQLLSLTKNRHESRISPLSSRSNSHNELKSLSLPPSPSAISLNKFAEDLMPITPEIDPILARSLIHDIIHFVKDPLVSLNDLCSMALKAAHSSLMEENEECDGVKEPEEINDDNCGCHSKESKGSPETLKYSQENTESGFRDPIDTKDLCAIAQLLETAIAEFEVAEGRCLHLIHQQLLFTPHLHTPFPEPMLIVFSGIFSVRGFAKELIKLLEEIPRFQALRPSASMAGGILRTGPVKSKKTKRWWRPKVGFTNWLKGYRASEEPRKAEHYSTNTTIHEDDLAKMNKEFIETQNEVDLEEAEEDPLQLPNQKWFKPEYSKSFPALKEPNSFSVCLRTKFWKLTKQLSTFEVQYGLKLTLTMVLLTFPAFVPAFSNFYINELRGQWGAIAAMSIINQTIGGTLYMGLARLSGTILGATWGYLTYLVNSETQNIYLVIVMIWMFNAPAWYTIISTNYSRIGMNGLVTFCVVLFVDYNKNDHKAMVTIVVFRTLSVVAGLIAAMVISAIIWPYVARNEVRKLVAGLMADMGVNFGKVAALCMSPHTSDRIELDQQIRSQQYQLQKRILGAKTLLVFAEKEPRLKGPFPLHIYEEELRILQDILDQLVAMRGAVLQISPEVQATVISPFNAYRKFMVSSVILYFYVLAGALLAKQPLPPYPPPIHAIRHKLMLKTRSAMVRKYNRSHGRATTMGITSLRRDLSLGALTSLLNESNSATPNPISQINPTILKKDFNHIYWYTYMAGLVRLFEDVELLGHNVAGLVGEATLSGLDQIVIKS